MRNTSLRNIFAITSLATAVAVGLAGCVRVHHDHHAHVGRPLVVAAQLNCPQSQGWLKRVSVSADGDTCDYHREDGELVTLMRLPLTGQTPQAALAPIESSLKALVPPRKDSAPPDAKANSEGGDSAHIDVPGVHIDAHGDKAEVRVFGVTVAADNDKADVHAGLGSDKAVVSADESGAEVRATDVNAVNANLVLILASEKPGPTGFRAVGYIARGPVAGPLVVAEFKSVAHHSGINDDHDIHRLMDLNLSH